MAPARPGKCVPILALPVVTSRGKAQNLYGDLADLQDATTPMWLD